MEKPNDKNDHISKAIDITIKLGFLLLLFAWCFQIIWPFANVVIWAIIISVTLYPFYKSISQKLGKKKKLTATIITIILLAILIIPSIKFTSSMIEGIKDFGGDLKNKNIHIPPPSDDVAKWPVIGNTVHSTWQLASNNLQGLLKTYEAELVSAGSWLLNAIVGTGMGLLQFIISIIIAGILLVGSDNAYKMSRKFFRKLVGEESGDEFASVTEITIRQVAKGVVGVSFIQSFLLGAVFLLAGIPYAGLWALLCLILGIIQIGPGLVSLFVIIYLFSVEEPLIASLWTVLIVLLTLLDNILKPMLMGKGAPVPTLVIFLGAIGGMIVSGFLGLFIGAIVLSLGYKLFIAWVNDGHQEKTISIENI